MAAKRRTYHIALLEGDGIGPEVTSEMRAVVNAAGDLHDFGISWSKGLVGGAAVDDCGNPLPDETITLIRTADAVFLGAVGGPKWDHVPREQRPESGLLRLRAEMGVFANLRPCRVAEALADLSPLKADRVAGVDLLVVRELTGGIYFGKPSERTEESALSTMVYSVSEIERITRVAFAEARKRKNKVTSVDKANVLTVSQLWRDTVNRLHQDEFSDVLLDHMYVDNAAMQLVLNPSRFDVILTGNLFGDILSDISAVLGGSLGLLPSASLGADHGLFEPVHGSAPDIAGQQAANPCAAILSGAMMLDYLGEHQASADIRNSVEEVLSQGFRTTDLVRPGDPATNTSEMGRLICAGLKSSVASAAIQSSDR